MSSEDIERFVDPEKELDPSSEVATDSADESDGDGGRAEESGNAKGISSVRRLLLHALSNDRKEELTHA